MPLASLNDFLVNSTTANEQLLPSVTQMADGRLFYTWTSEQTSGMQDFEIRGRILSADGQPTSADFLVNSTTTGLHRNSNVVTLNDGRMVVSWDYQGTTGTDIRFRIYNSDGTAAGPDTIVNSTTVNAQQESSISKLANGNFIVSWYSDEGGANGLDIRARIFSSSGVAVGSDIIINSTRTNAQASPSVTQLANGNIVMSWESVNAAGTDFDIRARVYTSTGIALANDFIVNTSGINSNTGQFNPAVQALTDGRFFVAWESSETNFEIRGRYFSATGAGSGSDFVINTSLLTNDRDVTTAVLKDGRLMVMWTTNVASPTPLPSDIRARIYNTDGTASGTDFLVNSSTSGDQTNPSIRVLADGRLAVTWTSADEIRSTIINPLIFNGTDSTDSWSGGVFAEVMYGYLGSDALSGNGGADKIYGDAGNDVIRGGTSGDLLYGGTDNDDIFGDSSEDKLYGEFGNDTLDGGSSNDVLYGGAGADELNGGTGTDYASYYTSAASVKVYLDGSGTNTGDATGDTFISVENLSGSNIGNDSIKGNSGANTLKGNGGADTISGGDGDDTLVGGSGKDRLIGGTGRDKFYYESVSQAGDTLTSFSSADFFVFKSSAFGNLKKGTLSSSAFWANTTGNAHDTSDRFILETDTGELYYDSNGSTAGGTRVEIADSDVTFSMTYADILIV